MNTTVFIVTGLNNGGIENYLFRYIEQEGVHFDKIHIYCKSGKFGQLESKFRSFSNTVLTKQKLGYLSFLAHLRLFLFLKKTKPKSICDFTGDFAGLTLLIAKIVGVPIRISFYRNSSIRYKTNFFKRLYNKIVQKLTVNYSTELLSNSKAAIDSFYPRNIKARNKFTVIRNGINSDLFKSSKQNIRNDLEIPKEAFLVGHVGRFNPSKNHKTIIDVAVQICHENSEIYFVLCGNGVKDALLEKIRTTGLASRIKLLNNVEKVIEIYNSIDCFYFPSITEGQPNALIEAMICGVPFVASNIPSIMETVLEEDHGSLIDMFDVESAKKKILEIKNGKVRKVDCKKIAKIYNAQDLFSKFTQKLTK